MRTGNRAARTIFACRAVWPHVDWPDVFLALANSSSCARTELPSGQNPLEPLNPYILSHRRPVRQITGRNSAGKTANSAHSLPFSWYSCFSPNAVCITLIARESRTLKQVIAIIKPYLVEKVLDALKHAPLEACGVCEVKGYGRQKSYLDEYRGSEYSLAFLPKVEITLWVDDLRVEEVVRRHRRNRPHGPHGRRQDLRHARHARRRVGRRRVTVGPACG